MRVLVSNNLTVIHLSNRSMTSATEAKLPATPTYTRQQSNALRAFWKLESNMCASRACDTCGRKSTCNASTSSGLSSVTGHFWCDTRSWRRTLPPFGMIARPSGGRPLVEPPPPPLPPEAAAAAALASLPGRTGVCALGVLFLLVPGLAGRPRSRDSARRAAPFLGATGGRAIFRTPSRGTECCERLSLSSSPPPPPPPSILMFISTDRSSTPHTPTPTPSAAGGTPVCECVSALLVRVSRSMVGLIAFCAAGLRSHTILSRVDAPTRGTTLSRTFSASVRMRWFLSCRASSSSRARWCVCCVSVAVKSASSMRSSSTASFCSGEGSLSALMADGIHTAGPTALNHTCTADSVKSRVVFCLSEKRESSGSSMALACTRAPAAPNASPSWCTTSSAALDTGLFWSARRALRAVKRSLRPVGVMWPLPFPLMMSLMVSRASRRVFQAEASLRSLSSLVLISFAMLVRGMRSSSDMPLPLAPPAAAADPPLACAGRAMADGAPPPNTLPLTHRDGSGTFSSFRRSHMSRSSASVLSLIRSTAFLSPSSSVSTAEPAYRCSNTTNDWPAVRVPLFLWSSVAFVYWMMSLTSTVPSPNSVTSCSRNLHTHSDTFGELLSLTALMTRAAVNVGVTCSLRSKNKELS
mmetsp:Transcript_6616/g.16011  ORF Transcript_6616/g.16011 Transcript_6616/m.16011 type:complete len:640 (-) Transcript_6616:323-2242(-)